MFFVKTGHRHDALNAVFWGLYALSAGDQGIMDCDQSKFLLVEDYHLLS